MGSQFSEEFLLGYRAGHRDGFADALMLVRDVLTPHTQSRAVASREAQLGHLLSGNGLLGTNGRAEGQAVVGAGPQR